MRNFVDFIIKNINSIIFLILISISITQIFSRNYYHGSKINLFSVLIFLFNWAGNVEEGITKVVLDLLWYKASAIILLGWQILLKFIKFSEIPSAVFTPITKILFFFINVSIFNLFFLTDSEGPIIKIFLLFKLISGFQFDFGFFTKILFI